MLAAHYCAWRTRLINKPTAFSIWRVLPTLGVLGARRTVARLALQDLLDPKAVAVEWRDRETGAALLASDTAAGQLPSGA